MTQPVDECRTLTLQETCDVLRITRRTALGLIGRGELIAFKVGQGWRIDTRDLDTYIERQKQATQRDRNSESAAWAG